MTVSPYEFDSPGTYRIKVSGIMDSAWSDRLGGMTIATRSEDDPPVTTLYGELADEAALAGVLSALYNLGYSLQLVKKVKGNRLVERES